MLKFSEVYYVIFQKNRKFYIVSFILSSLLDYYAR